MSNHEHPSDEEAAHWYRFSDGRRFRVVKVTPPASDGRRFRVVTDPATGVLRVVPADPHQ